MIVCCGEAVIDMLPRKGPSGLELFQPVVGGSIFNTAIALARLNVKTGFFSGLSQDFFGGQLVEALKASGVALDYVKMSEQPSTLAFVRLEKGQASYSFYDENSAARMITRKDLPKFGSEVQALHFGSISLIAEPGASSLENLLLKESKRRVISLDPNIRPSFIKNRRPYLARLKRLIAACDLLKISEEDVAWLKPQSDLAKAAKGWLKQGAKIVIITRGGDGVMAYTSGYELVVKAPKVKVVDTVGAGDTFTAGLLAALSEAKLLDKKSLGAIAADQLEQALAYAAKAASITCSREGANPPWADEMAAKRA